MATKIEWVARPGTTPESWNPVSGCTKLSEGCRHCYAERMARRLAGRCGYPEAPNHFDVTLHEHRLELPLHWRKPRTIFLCSMSDFCHEDIPGQFLNKIWRTIRHTPQHTYLILTKRPKRLLSLMKQAEAWSKNWNFEFPLPNVWGMVTVESQEHAWRIEELLKCPFVVRGVSVEPMLSEITLPDLQCGLSWCIIGAESGPGARPMDENWVRRLIVQCREQKIAVFYKQKMVKGKKLSLPTLDSRQYVEFPQTIDKPSGN